MLLISALRQKRNIDTFFFFYAVDIGIEAKKKYRYFFHPVSRYGHCGKHKMAIISYPVQLMADDNTNVKQKIQLLI